MITVHVLHGETRICTQPMGCDMGGEEKIFDLHTDMQSANRMSHPTQR
jgi:hypothetical protein